MGGAGGRDTGKDSGGATVADADSCCCGTDDAADRGVDEDSGVTPVDCVDGWCHASKPRGAYDCWAGSLTPPPLSRRRGPGNRGPSTERRAPMDPRQMGRVARDA